MPWLRAARFKYGADVQILDISANGIRVMHYSEIAVGAPVVLQFSTATCTTSVEARVVHCREVEISGWTAYEIGCRFARALPRFAQDPTATAVDTANLPPVSMQSTPLPPGHQPLWAERVVAGCCELAAGVGIAVALLLVLADWAHRLFS